MTIDLRSDTVTRPTAAMRRAMADAEVGDDVLDGDPTVRLLEERTAEMLGKEASLFFPSGTMANQCAIWLLARPGTEILLDENAHIIHYEMAGAAALCGAQIRPVQGRSAVMDAEALREAFRTPSPHYPTATLVCVENTHNGAGGKITSLDGLRAIQEVARARGLPVHLDGARLWNASTASGTALAAFAACSDTVMVSFSKGLGAPVGAALAGSAPLIAEARYVRKRFGGGMRQSGILAAAALHALDVHLPRLAEDHERARALATLLSSAGNCTVVAPDTNIVMIDLPPGQTSTAVAARAAEQGVLVTAWLERRLRAVLHLDVDDAQVRLAAEVVAAVLEETS